MKHSSISSSRSNLKYRVATEEKFVEIKTRSCNCSIILIFSILMGVTVFCLVGMTLFWSISSVIYSFRLQNTDRLEKIAKVGNQLFSYMEDIEETIWSLHGLRRSFAEWMLSDDKNLRKRLIITFWNHVKAFSEKIGTNLFTFSVNLFILPSTIYSISSYMGMYMQGNGTNDCMNYFYDLDESVHEEDDNEMMTIKPGLNYSWYLPDDVILEYSWPWHTYSYYVGWSGIDNSLQPHVSFSSSEREFLVGPNQENVTVNLWYGRNIHEFSVFLQKSKPIDSITWLIELNNEFIIGTSNEENWENVINVDVVDVQNSTFTLVRDYVFNPEIQKVSIAILDNPVLMNNIKNKRKEVVQFTIGGNDITVMYFNSSKYYGNILLVNSKKIWSIYKRPITYLIISGCICVFIFVSLVIVWFCLFDQMKRAFTKLILEMNKVEEMELNDIDLSAKPVWVELKKISENFVVMVNMLKEYRAFIPNHLVGGEDKKSFTKSVLSVSSSSNIVKISNADDDSSHTSDNSHGESALTTLSELDKKQKFQLGVLEKMCISLKLSFEFKPKALHDVFYSDVFNVIGRYNGEIFDFSDDFVLVFFHSSMVRKAVECACWLMKKKYQQHCLQFQCLIVKGTAFTGNIGCILRKKQFCKGEIMENLTDMENRCPPFVRICIDENSSKSVESIFETRIIDIGLYEIGRLVKVKNDEWMYELKERESFLRWKNYNDGVRIFLKKSNDSYIEKAEASMKIFLKEHPDDLLGLYWMKKIQGIET